MSVQVDPELVVLKHAPLIDDVGGGSVSMAMSRTNPPEYASDRERLVGGATDRTNTWLPDPT